MTVEAAVLVGGASSRMGVDKALLEVDGVPMALRVAHALGHGVDRFVYLIGGLESTAERLGLGHIPDRLPGEGPMVGVWSALHHLDDDVLVAACDLPDLDPVTVQSIAAHDHRDVDVVVAVADGRRQPSLARWGIGSLAAIETAICAGRRSMLDVLGLLRVAEVECGADALLNANCISDLDGRSNVRTIG